MWQAPLKYVYVPVPLVSLYAATALNNDLIAKKLYLSA